MSTHAKRRSFVISSGCAALALAGCIAPPPSSGVEAPPGSPASIHGTGAAAPAPSPSAAAPAAAAAGAPSSGGGATASTAASLAAAGYKECPGSIGLIDDGEDGNNQNLPVGDRGGYWYTFRDKKGTTVDPMAGEDGGTFVMTEGQGHASKFGACYRGKVGLGDPLFAGLGVNFVDPKAGYDASKFAGIAFWAKRGENSTGKVRLKVPDVNTDPEGGVCKECFNDYGGDMNLSPEWKFYIYPWNALKQMPGWGNPRRPHITPSQVYGVQLQVNVPHANYDICIDDLQFICK